MGLMRILQVVKARFTRLAVLDDQFSLRLFSRILFKPLETGRDEHSPQHLVIDRPGSTRDVLVAAPAMAAIRKRFPQAHISLLIAGNDTDAMAAREVLAVFPGFITRLLSYQPDTWLNRNEVSALKHQLAESGPIDLWVRLPATDATFQQSSRDMLLARWLGSRNAIGFTVLLPDNLQTVYARFYKDKIPRTADWLLNVVKTGLSIESDANDHLNWFEPPAQWDATTYGLDPARPILAIHAGAERSIDRWPAAHFRILLQKLETQLTDLQFVLLGTDTDRLLNDTLASTLTRPAPNLSGRLSVAETWSLLNQAAAVLCNNTAVMHMAGLLRKPVLTPMSGQFPSPLWHPPGPPLLEFHKPVPCAPCFKTVCPLNEQICMTLLTPDLIAPHILELLSTILG